VTPCDLQQGVGGGTIIFMAICGWEMTSLLSVRHVSGGKGLLLMTILLFSSIQWSLENTAEYCEGFRVEAEEASELAVFSFDARILYV
jgi:hypothetical protein